MEYIVTVNLSKRTQSDIIQQILAKISSDFIRIQPNTWIIVSNKSVVEIRDQIFTYITRDDRLFIGGLNGTYDGLFESDESDYLRLKIFDRLL